MAQSKEEFFKEAIQLHEQGIAGNKEAVKKAFSLLEKLKTQYPNDLLIQAYYGSTLTLLGRDETDPIKRFNLTTRGLKILDKIVAQTPDNVQVRLLRAHIAMRLPEEYFHRTKTAIEDFSYLKSAYEQDNSLFSFSTYQQIVKNLENLGVK